MKIDIPNSIHGSNFVIMFTHSVIEGNEMPVMAICGKRLKSSYFIPLENAYLYADSITGEPTDELMKLIVRITEALGLGDDRFIAHELAGKIVDALPELLTMPPKTTDSAAETRKKLEDVGLKVDIDGINVLDAS